MQPDIDRAEAVAAMDLSAVHPRVFHSPEDIARARANAADTDWGEQLADAVVALATDQPFLDRSAAAIRELAPIPDPDGRLYVGFPYHKFETLAHGNVCPIDGTGLDMVGLDTPGEVICQEGHRFPGDHDDIAIEDDGSGWTPTDVPDTWAASGFEDTTFRFVAEYNGWICKAMERALEPLAYAYVLTEEDRFAETVATLLDVLADAYRRHETLVGYAYGDHPGSRLFRPGYQVGRALKDMANAADLVWTHQAMGADSAMQPGASIRERVAEDLVIEGADFIWENMGKYARLFNNGTGDYNEGLAAAASLLALDVGYAEWAFDGPVSLEKFLTNTVFADGQYFETAEMYAVSFLEWAELATELRTPTYPEGIDVYDNDRFVDLNTRGPARFALAGRLPQYGDTGWPDTDVTAGPYRGHFWKVLRYYVRADGAARREHAQELARIAGGRPNDRLLDRTVSRSDPAQDLWPLFNLDGGIDAPPDEQASDPGPRPSELLPRKGFAMLRPSTGHDRGAMIRYGPTLNHGHCDELGLHLYGAGRELSYDPGHKPKRHFLHSYLKQTVAHNTVVVNETSQVPPTDPGGSVAFFGTGDGYTAVELSNPGAYAHEDVDEYRRTLAYLDVDANRSYLVDLFRVGGSNLETVDYAFHGGGVGFDTSLAFGDRAEGSVADPSYDWGRNLRSSGELVGFEEEDHFFNAPPGNAYGFLGQPRRASGEPSWDATWTVEREDPPGAIRLSMAGAADRTVIGADAPDLLVEALDLDPADETLPVLLARDTDVEHTTFAAVVEGGGGEFAVEDVRKLPVDADDPAPDAVAIGVELTDGRTDFVVSVSGDSPVTVDAGAGTIRTDAALATVRVRDGTEVVAVHLERGTVVEANIGGEPVELNAVVAERVGTLVDVDHDTATLTVSEGVQEAVTDATYVDVDAPAYTHNSPYTVTGTDAATDGLAVETRECDTTLGVGVIEAIEGDVIVSAADFPLTDSASPYVEAETGNTYFDGKRIAALDGPGETEVHDVDETNRRLRVADASGFAVGDEFVVRDVTPGDRVTIPTSESWYSG